MIHTVLPMESVFPPESQSTVYRESDFSIRYGHITTLTDAVGHTEVSGLFSTDPYDYLNTAYRPGAVWTG